jgi:hypothetical protein
MAQDQGNAGGEGEEGALDVSSDFDLVPIFSSSNFDAELEANNIHGLLEASGVPSIVVGATVIPSLEFQVRVPRAQLKQAERLVAAARAGGPEAAAAAEAASEE